MIVFIMTCWAVGVQPVECGQYISYERCWRAGPFVSALTALEFKVSRMDWTCRQVNLMEQDNVKD